MSGVIELPAHRPFWQLDFVGLYQLVNLLGMCEHLQLTSAIPKTGRIDTRLLERAPSKMPICHSD
jgi:hypothetical protein